MDIGVGSVVTYDKYSSNEPYVITGMKNWEDYGSCCYSREYFIMPLSQIENKDYITENEGTKIDVKGVTKLPFTLVDGQAPFKIIREVKYKVERMKAKTITIYE